MWVMCGVECEHQKCHAHIYVRNRRRDRSNKKQVQGDTGDAFFGRSGRCSTTETGRKTSVWAAWYSSNECRWKRGATASARTSRGVFQHPCLSRRTEFTTSLRSHQKKTRAPRWSREEIFNCIPYLTSLSLFSRHFKESLHQCQNLTDFNTWPTAAFNKRFTKESLLSFVFSPPYILFHPV